MLTINTQKRYLLKNGAFFPYLADTAWTLLQMLTRSEIRQYLNRRKQQGFNAIQMAALSELDGIRKPNAEGVCPFENGEPAKPNEKYFSLLCFVADECEKRNMVLVLLPTWGDKFNQKDGAGPEIFTPENAAAYGRYLAQLIGTRENVIWMLGGDRPLEAQTHRRIIDGMASGLRAGETVYHLMTYHPSGEASSTDFLPDAPYIDFHSLQSSHSFGGFQSDVMVSDALKKGQLPVLDAECFYEDFPIGFDVDWNYRLTPLDIRRRLYRNTMAGALGNTYGHQSVWCFHKAADAEYLYDWKTALNRPMANQMCHLNRLLEEFDWPSTRQSDIAKNAPAREGDGFALIYAENTEPVFLDLGDCPKETYMQWFDPVTGIFTRCTLCKGKHLTVSSPFLHDAVCLLRFGE